MFSKTSGAAKVPTRGETALFGGGGFTFEYECGILIGVGIGNSLISLKKSRNSTNFALFSLAQFAQIKHESVNARKIWYTSTRQSLCFREPLIINFCIFVYFEKARILFFALFVKPMRILQLKLHCLTAKYSKVAQSMQKHNLGDLKNDVLVVKGSRLFSRFLPRKNDGFWTNLFADSTSGCVTLLQTFSTLVVSDGNR